MTAHIRKSLVILALMIAASAMAYALKPTQKMAELGPKFDLESLVPRSFGDWRMDDASSVILPSPTTQAAINKIYNQTLSRTYINNRGQRVMLSIAYGGDQSDAMQVHMPEGCYAGQGFSIKDQAKEVLQTAFGPLPVSRLIAHQGPRFEPITYWIVVGDEIARNTWEMKMIKLRYSLKGLIPEGLLFRVSSITSQSLEGYATHVQFADDLMAAIPPEKRTRFFGNVR